MFESFTERAKNVVKEARTIASERGAKELHSADLLLAIVRDTDSVGSRILGALGVRDQIGKAMEYDEVPEDKRLPGKDLPYTKNAKSVLETAYTLAYQLGFEGVGTEHLLVAVGSGENSSALAAITETGGFDSRGHFQEQVFDQLEKLGILKMSSKKQSTSTEQDTAFYVDPIKDADDLIGHLNHAIIWRSTDSTEYRNGVVEDVIKSGDGSVSALKIRSMNGTMELPLDLTVFYRLKNYRKVR